MSVFRFQMNCLLQAKQIPCYRNLVEDICARHLWRKRLAESHPSICDATGKPFRAALLFFVLLGPSGHKCSPAASAAVLV